MGNNVQTVYSGPSTGLPATFQFQPQFDGDVLLYLAGSAWSNSAGAALSLHVEFDGNPIGSAGVFTNESASHKALVANIIPFTIPGDGQPHTLRVSAGTGETVVDSNDQLQMVLIDIDVAENAFIWNTAGPVPAYTTFKSNFSGTANCLFAGSGFLGQSGSSGLVLVLDHNPVATSSFYWNQPESHRALAPMIVPLQLTDGPHQIGLSTSDGDLASDGNDLFTIAVWW